MHGYLDDHTLIRLAYSLCATNIWIGHDGANLCREYSLITIIMYIANPNSTCFLERNMDHNGS